VIRPAVLLVALVLSAPAVYRYIIDQVDVDQVLIRFLIAVPIAAVLLAGLRFVTAGYGRTVEESDHATTVTPSAMGMGEADRPSA
jgi:hypothetical protein